MRDYSSNKKMELYQALDAIAERNMFSYQEWYNRNRIECGIWMEKLYIDRYALSIEDYHKQILDMNSEVRRQIEQVFCNVAEIEIIYTELLRKRKDILQEHINKLCEYNVFSANGGLKEQEPIVIREPNRDIVEKNIFDFSQIEYFTYEDAIQEVERMYTEGILSEEDYRYFKSSIASYFCVPGGDALLIKKELLKRYNEIKRTSFVCFLNGESDCLDYEGILSDIDRMYEDGYFCEADYQYYRMCVLSYSHAPGGDKTAIKEQMINHYTLSKENTLENLINNEIENYNYNKIKSDIDRLYEHGYMTPMDYQYYISMLDSYMCASENERENFRKEIGLRYEQTVTTYEKMQVYISEETFEDLGWNMQNVKEVCGEDFIDDLRANMIRGGIVEETSVKMFLATISHETGDGNSLVEIGVESSYTNDTKGAGLMQITGATQQSYIQYLIDTVDDDRVKQDLIKFNEGYYTENGEICNDVKIDGLSPTEYIAKYYSIDSAIWCWTIYDDKTCINGESASINDFINYYSDIPETDKLFLVTQMAINGTEYKASACEEMCIWPERMTYDSVNVYYKSFSDPVPVGWEKRIEAMDKVEVCFEKINPY